MLDNIEENGLEDILDIVFNVAELDKILAVIEEVLKNELNGGHSTTNTR